MTEIQVVLFIGSGTILLNILGWVWSLNRNSKKDAYYSGVIKTEVNNLTKRYNSLPCVGDKTYERKMGSMFQEIKDIKERVVRIEAKQNMKT